LFVKNCVSFGLVWGIGGKFAYFFHFYHVGVSVVVGIVVFPAMVASIGVNYGQNYKLTPKTEAEGRVRGSNAPLTSLRFLPSIFFPPSHQCFCFSFLGLGIRSTKGRRRGEKKQRQVILYFAKYAPFN
jgi:hypothetical protein